MAWVGRVVEEVVGVVGENDVAARPVVEGAIVRTGYSSGYNLVASAGGVGAAGSAVVVVVVVGIGDCELVDFVVADGQNLRKVSVSLSSWMDSRSPNQTRFAAKSRHGLRAEN